MGIFRSTSAKPRAGSRALACTALALTALLLVSLAPLRAGTVITLTGGSEIDGKLSVAGAAIHAEAESSPPDTALTDVLESRFDDAPFALHVFQPGKINQLPANWVAQDIGDVATHGSVTVQSGTFTLNGCATGTQGGGRNHDRSDSSYFVGVPWPDNNSQFTARLTSLDPALEQTYAGIAFRDSLGIKAPMCGAHLNGMGTLFLPFRGGRGGDHGGMKGTANLPVWLRLSRYGNTVYVSMSTDGDKWDILSENPFKELAGPLFGLEARSATDKVTAKAVFDQVSITPLPSSAQVLPAGILLQGGSLLVGRAAHFDFDPAAADDNGEIIRGGEDNKMTVSRSLIAGIVMLPIERKQLQALSTQPGVVMRNGDTTDGQVTAVSEEQISVSSVLLGITNYKSIEIGACFLAPLQSKPAAFEVRLRDGSILNASAVSADANEVVITDVCGLQIQVGTDEVAQVRAGSAVVQDLAQVDWKATAPTSAASATPPAMAPGLAPPAPAANGAAPPANPAPEPDVPLVQSWLGNDQEQILQVATDTSLDFPLPGKFRAFGMQVALGSDSPPNATATISILVDGHELAKSPPFRAGDSPRFLEMSLPTAAHITLQAQSIFPGVKMLYIDPVAIR